MEMYNLAVATIGVFAYMIVGMYLATKLKSPFLFFAIITYPVIVLAFSTTLWITCLSLLLPVLLFLRRNTHEKIS